MNFQINRVLTYGEEAGLLEEIKSVIPKIKDFESWYVEWVALAKKAENEGRYLHAAYYYRMADFAFPVTTAFAKCCGLRRGKQ